MTVPRIVRTTEDLRALPDGTVVRSIPDCGWPQRYAGRRYVKQDNLTLVPLDPDPHNGLNYVAFLPTFKDPLPVEVVLSATG